MRRFIAQILLFMMLTCGVISLAEQCVWCSDLEKMEVEKETEKESQSDGKDAQKDNIQKFDFLSDVVLVQPTIFRPLSMSALLRAFAADEMAISANFSNLPELPPEPRI